MKSAATVNDPRIYAASLEAPRGILEVATASDTTLRRSDIAHTKPESNPPRPCRCLFAMPVVCARGSGRSVAIGCKDVRRECFGIGVQRGHVCRQGHVGVTTMSLAMLDRE